MSYTIDIYVDGKRIDYFESKGIDITERLEHIKNWALGQNMTRFKIVQRMIDYWFIYDFHNNEFKRIAKIYLSQIDRISEIEQVFEKYLYVDTHDYKKNRVILEHRSGTNRRMAGFTDEDMHAMYYLLKMVSVSKLKELVASSAQEGGL